MSNISYKCPYCLKDIFLTEEFVVCPRCGRHHHKKCWDINNGCSVYDCRYQIEKPSADLILNPEKLLVEVEYLYNIKCFEDAYIQCLKIIDLFPDYISAKILFNRICFVLSIKNNLLKRGEEALLKKDYLAAKKFYVDLLDYVKDSEKESLEQKINYIDYAVKDIERRKKQIRIFQLLVFGIIFISLVFLYVHLIIDADKREFYRITANIPETPQMIEAQIIDLEQFLRKYPESTVSKDAIEKIAQLSDEYIKLIYHSDWKKAVKYLTRIDSLKYSGTYQQDYNLLLTSGKNIVNKLIDSARQLNNKTYYSHSRALLEQAREISVSLNGMESLTEIVEKGIGILNRKISTGNKLNEVRKEIVEKKKQLETIKSELGSVEKKTFMVKSKRKKNLYLVEDLPMGTLCLLYTESQLIDNEVVDIICQKEKGRDIQLSGKDNFLPRYREFAVRNSEIVDGETLLLERASIEQRLNYLREMEKKLDSILTKTF